MAGKHYGTDLYPIPDVDLSGVAITPAFPGSRINRAWAEGNDNSRPNTHVTGSPEDLAYIAGRATSRNWETAPPVTATPTITVPDKTLVGPITETPGTPDTAWVTDNDALAFISAGTLTFVAGGIPAFTNIQGVLLLEGTNVRVSWGLTSVGNIFLNIGAGTLVNVDDASIGFADLVVGPEGNALQLIGLTPSTIDADVLAEIT